jgi:cytochrome c2
MKWNVRYASKDLIPKGLEEFYVEKNGAWVLDHENFDGLETLVADGLTRNRDALKVEKTTAQAKAEEAEQKARQLQEEIDKLRKPGSKIFDKTEAEEFDAYRALGPVKDLDKKIKAGEEAAGELTKTKTQAERAKLAKQLGWDEEALQDFLDSPRASGIELTVKEVKTKDKKNQEVMTYKPIVKRTVKKDGKDYLDEVDFDKFSAETEIPKYILNGLLQKSETNEPEKKSSVHFPSLSSNKAKTDDGDGQKWDAKKSAESFNAQRSTRPTPWEKPVAQDAK